MADLRILGREERAAIRSRHGILHRCLWGNNEDAIYVPGDRCDAIRALDAFEAASGTVRLDIDRLAAALSAAAQESIDTLAPLIAHAYGPDPGPLAAVQAALESLNKIRPAGIHVEQAAQALERVLPPAGNHWEGMGWVCDVCGQPTESEPCADHQRTVIEEADRD